MQIRKIMPSVVEYENTSTRNKFFFPIWKVDNYQWQILDFPKGAADPVGGAKVRRDDIAEN